MSREAHCEDGNWLASSGWLLAPVRVGITRNVICSCVLAGLSSSLFLYLDQKSWFPLQSPGHTMYYNGFTGCLRPVRRRIKWDGESPSFKQARCHPFFASAVFRDEGHHGEWISRAHFHDPTNAPSSLLLDIVQLRCQPSYAPLSQWQPPIPYQTQ